MARNLEKSQSMLFRFREQQAAEFGLIDLKRTRRPNDPSECTSADEAEKWRAQIIRDISRKVGKIQDMSLSDYQLRDLNDEINKSLNEKNRWEVQLKSLGGPDYLRFQGKQFDEDGKDIRGKRGYRYFGRAKELPGVKEILEEESRRLAQGPIVVRQDIKHNVDAAYFGYEDEDPELLEYERQVETRRLKEMELAENPDSENIIFPSVFDTSTD